MDKQFAWGRIPMSFGTFFFVFWVEANYFLIQSSLSLTRRSKCITERRNVLSSIFYSGLIDTIFLEPHIFFMRMCSRLVLAGDSTHWPREERRPKKGQCFPNSSLYADKNELLPYLGRHCYWMISLRTRLALCVGLGHFYDFKETLFNCFICSSTLLFCQKRMDVSTPKGKHYIMPSHVLWSACRQQTGSGISFRSNPFISLHFIHRILNILLSAYPPCFPPPHPPVFTSHLARSNSFPCSFV